MEEGIETKTNEDLEGKSGGSLEAPDRNLPSTEFVKVEKNLASLGFFTPSSKRLRNAQEKSFTVTTVTDGQRLEQKGTIIPSAKYGLPITADQDKWIALCKILTDIIRKEGRVTNPVSFTSAEILRLLRKHRHSGKNYREIEEWLDVLFSTTIFSEGVVYLAGEKRRVKDRYRVFDRAVSFGKELSDGKVADKNYVWFSDWQIQNINNNHLLPIDLEAYRELKNHIAKALVPLLQIWLYATRREGVYEKRYDELCQFLNITRYRYESLIKRTLGPSLDELKQFGYLADWQIERTSDGENYKIVFYHGEKFHRDRRTRESSKLTANGSATISERRQQSRPLPRDNRSEPTLISAPVPRHFDPMLVSELTQRGINEKKAHELLANLKPGQEKHLLAQVELAEQHIQESQNTPHPVRNAPGFIIHLIEYNTPIPDGFETKAQRAARAEREREEGKRRAAKEARQQLEWEYDEYRDLETDHYIEANQATFAALKDAKSKEERGQFGFTTESMVRIAARFEMQKQITFLTFEEFLERKKQGTDFFLKPVGLSPAPEVTPVAQKTEDATATIDHLAVPSDPIATAQPEAAILLPGPAMEPAIPETAEPRVPPAIPEPLMIELVSDPPPIDSGGTTTEQGMA
jgi:Replication initiator protein A